MTHTKPTRLRRQGRIFPEYSIPSEELDKREAEKQARVKRYQEIFVQASSQLLQDYYNWFIVIEPHSGDYFIDPQEEVAVQKARLKYPNGMVGIMRVNETGNCGKNMMCGRFGEIGELIFEIGIKVIKYGNVKYCFSNRKSANTSFRKKCKLSQTKSSRVYEIINRRTA